MNDEIHGRIVRLCRSFYRRPMINRLSIELGDLVGAAYVGLLESEKTYDKRKGPLWPYAKKQCTHEIIEEIRRNSPVLPRHRLDGKYPLQVSFSL